MPTVELLNGHRSRLLDVKIRTSVLDDLVTKALATVQDKYSESDSIKPDDDSSVAGWRDYDPEAGAASAGGSGETL